MHIHAHPNHPLIILVQALLYILQHFQQWPLKRYLLEVLYHVQPYFRGIYIYMTEDKMFEFLLWCNFLTVKILPMPAGAHAAPMARDLHPCLQWAGADVDGDCSVEDGGTLPHTASHSTNAFPKMDGLPRTEISQKMQRSKIPLK